VVPVPGETIEPAAVERPILERWIQLFFGPTDQP
jgi:hypothetical protein